MKLSWILRYLCSPNIVISNLALFDISNSIWSKELQNKPRYDERSTDAPRKGGIKRGNKVVIRNHKLLKINDLKTNLLEPGAPIKQTSNHLIIR